MKSDIEKGFEKITDFIQIEYKKSGYKDFIEFYKYYKELFTIKTKNKIIICGKCNNRVLDRYFIGMQIETNDNKIYNHSFEERCLDELVKLNIIEGGLVETQ